jgi:sigma-B regulation protein RsbU (phosphoserine phosphatase)
MFPVLPPAQKSVALIPGDWLLIFSDGIPEAANSNEDDFGDQRLLETLTRMKNGTAAAICGRIVDEVREHIREQRQADDITLITAKVL